MIILMFPLSADGGTCHGKEMISVDYDEKMKILNQLNSSIALDKGEEPVPNMGNDAGRYIDERIAFESYTDEEAAKVKAYYDKQDKAVIEARAKANEEKVLEEKLKAKYNEMHGDQWHSNR